MNNLNNISNSKHQSYVKILHEKKKKNLTRVDLLDLDLDLECRSIFGCTENTSRISAPPLKLVSLFDGVSPRKY